MHISFLSDNLVSYRNMSSVTKCSRLIRAGEYVLHFLAISLTRITLSGLNMRQCMWPVC